MTISIIIPTYNRADTLNQTLSSIFSLERAEDCEVIVVDNGSTDDTSKICETYKNLQSNFSFYLDAEPGLLTGRHLGASKATGEILCFLDDDLQLSTTWLTGVRDAFADNAVQLATGPSLPVFEATPPSWLDYFWDKVYNGKACTWLSLLDLGDAVIDVHPNYVWGLNFCIRKKAMLELDGFHPDSVPQRFQMFQGDGETGLTMMAYKRGYKVIYHPLIKVHHLASAERLTVAYFKKRAYFQGVCNSYSAIREAYENHEKTTAVTLPKLIWRLMHQLKSKLKEILFTPTEIIQLKKELRQKEIEGYNFHQEAFKTNDTVKRWVLQKNYWNYKLPVNQQSKT